MGVSLALGDIQIQSGNVKLPRGHAEPDLALKALAGQDLLHILGEGKELR
jgi:hypothetical protein